MEKQRLHVPPVRCPYCHDAIPKGEEPAVCPACHALHHEECLQEHGACAACAADHPRYSDSAPARPQSVATTDKERGTASEPQAWVYEAVDAKGNRVRGQIPGNTREEAIEAIKGLGLFPTKVRDAALGEGSLDTIPFDLRTISGVLWILTALLSFVASGVDQGDDMAIGILLGCSALLPGLLNAFHRTRLATLWGVFLGCFGAGLICLSAVHPHIKDRHDETLWIGLAIFAVGAVCSAAGYFLSGSKTDSADEQNR